MTELLVKSLIVMVVLFAILILLAIREMRRKSAKEDISFFLLQLVSRYESILKQTGHITSGTSSWMKDMMLAPPIRSNFSNLMESIYYFPDRRLSWYFQEEYRDNSFLLKVLPMMKEVYGIYRKEKNEKKTLQAFEERLDLIIDDELDPVI